MSTAPRPALHHTILGAFRRNLIPGIILNVIALGLVVSYYHVAQAHGWWEAVGELKSDWGLWFAFVSTVLIAAVAPVIIQWLMGTLPTEYRIRRLLGLAAFWGYRGVEVDLFYRLQAHLFGDSNDVGTVVAKVAVDQFVYTMFWAAPGNALALRWADQGCNWQRTWASLDRDFVTHIFPAMLLTNWMIWIPAVSLVYCLPVSLQFPLAALVNCYFVLVMTLLAKRPGPTE
jgi:hypothetical protein